MATLSTTIIHCTPHQPVILDNVKVNIGSGYSSRNGSVKAPVSGVYAFSTTMSVDQHSSYNLTIVQGNVTNKIGYLYADPGVIWQMGSTTVISHLYSGEEVWIICLWDSTIQGNLNDPRIKDAQVFHSHFSGFLVSGD